MSQHVRIKPYPVYINQHSITEKCDKIASAHLPHLSCLRGHPTRGTPKIFLKGACHFLAVTLLRKRNNRSCCGTSSRWPRRTQQVHKQQHAKAHCTLLAPSVSAVQGFSRGANDASAALRAATSGATFGRLGTVIEHCRWHRYTDPHNAAAGPEAGRLAALG